MRRIALRLIHPMNHHPLAVLGSALLLLGCWDQSARADNRQVYCNLSIHDHTAVLVSGPCSLSQRQGDAVVRFQGKRYDFAAVDQGKGYTRTNLAQGIRFNREGDYTLTVLWRRPGVPARSPSCVMNPQLYGYNWKPCTISKTPGVRDGFTVSFSGSHDAPIFSFKPAPGSTPTTDGRLMLDAQGRRWRFSGHKSFVMSEIGGDHNRLEVSAW